MSNARTTIDHEEIRSWAEKREGRPAVARTDGPGGILRIDFGEPEERLDPVTWDEFFKIFDYNHLAFLFQERTSDGGKSRFNKFVERDV